MNNLNSLIIEGEVVSNDYLESNGVPMASTKLAVSRTYKNAEGKEIKEVSTFEVRSYGKLAEITKNYAKEGCCMRVVGRLKEEHWTYEGEDCSKVVIISEHNEYKKAKKQEVNNDLQF